MPQPDILIVCIPSKCAFHFSASAGLNNNTRETPLLLFMILFTDARSKQIQILFSCFRLYAVSCRSIFFVAKGWICLRTSTILTTIVFIFCFIQLFYADFCIFLPHHQSRFLSPTIFDPLMENHFRLFRQLPILSVIDNPTTLVFYEYQSALQFGSNLFAFH